MDGCHYCISTRDLKAKLSSRHLIDSVRRHFNYPPVKKNHFHRQHLLLSINGHQSINFQLFDEKPQILYMSYLLRSRRSILLLNSAHLVLQADTTYYSKVNDEMVNGNYLLDGPQ